MSETCPTVKIKTADGFAIINESDFDPKVHAPFDGKAPRMQGTPEELGTDSGDQFSDDQLREVIETVTGEKVHHRTGRDKLVAMYNELNVKA